MDINLNFLECFVSLSDTLSFTDTAQALRVSQPSVSRQIRLLEEQLGVQLFARDRHHVHLTEHGRKLRASLAPLIKEIQTHLASTKEQTDSFHGALSFGSLAEVGQSTFMRLLLDFKKKYPNVTLNVDFDNEGEVVEKVKTGSLDFGVVMTPMEGENVRAYHLMTERVVLVTRAKNTKEVGAVKDVHFIGYRKSDELITKFVRTYAKHLPFRKIHIDISVNSHRSMIEALLETDCYAVMPYFSIQPYIEEGKLRIAHEKELQNKLYLIHLENHLLGRKSLAFRDFLIQSCRKTQTRGLKGEKLPVTAKEE